MHIYSIPLATLQRQYVPAEKIHLSTSSPVAKEKANDENSTTFSNEFSQIADSIVPQLSIYTGHDENVLEEDEMDYDEEDAMPVVVNDDSSVNDVFVPLKEEGKEENEDESDLQEWREEETGEEAGRDQLSSCSYSECENISDANKIDDHEELEEFSASETAGNNSSDDQESIHDHPESQWNRNHLDYSSINVIICHLII